VKIFTLYQNPGRFPGFSKASKKSKTFPVWYSPMGAQRRKQGLKYSLSSSIAFTPKEIKNCLLIVKKLGGPKLAAVGSTGSMK